MIQNPKGTYCCAWCNRFLSHKDLRAGRYATQDDIDGRGFVCYRHYAAPGDTAPAQAAQSQGREEECHGTQKA